MEVDLYDFFLLWNEYQQIFITFCMRILYAYSKYAASQCGLLEI